MGLNNAVLWVEVIFFLSVFMLSKNGYGQTFRNFDFLIPRPELGTFSCSFFLKGRFHMKKLTLAELKIHLKSGLSSDLDIRWSQNLLEDKEFWQLPFSINQWREMASKLSPYRSIEALLRHGRSAPEIVYGVMYELFPEVSKRLMPLFVSNKHIALLSWAQSESCPSDLSEKIQRIAELENLLDKDLNRVMEELSQWKVDEVMFAICACADANVHSRKLWDGEWVPAYIFRLALTEIWNGWLERNYNLKRSDFKYAGADLPQWDMRVHGSFSFRFRRRADYEHELKDLGQQLLKILEHRFPKYLEIQSLRLMEMNQVEFSIEGPKGLNDLVFRSKLISLIDRRKVSDVHDQYQLAHFIMQCGELSPFFTLAKLEFEGYTSQDISSLPWKGLFKTASILQSINQGTRKDLDMSLSFNGIYQNLKEQGERWVGHLGVDRPMILARFKRDDLLRVIADNSEMEDYEGRELIHDMGVAGLGREGASFPRLASFSVESDNVYWPSGLFTFHTWVGYLQSLAVHMKRVRPNMLGLFREEFAKNCLSRIGFSSNRGLKCRLESGKHVELDVLGQYGNSAVIIEVKGFMNNPDLVQSTRKVSSALLDEALYTLQSVREELSAKNNQLDFYTRETDKVSLRSGMKVYYLILTNIEDQFTEIAPGVILCSVSTFDLLTNPDALKIAISLGELDKELIHILCSLKKILKALENNREEWAFLVGTSGQLWREEESGTVIA